MNTIKKIKVSELLPNPNRNLKYYKLNPERVNALIGSFKASGEWPGIIVRQREDGRYEKAFGEHRLEAHKRVFGVDSEIPIIVMDLDDAAMLRYMANENGEAWSNSFLAHMETIESTVKRFDEGLITLSTPSTLVKGIRKAPGFSILSYAEAREADRSKLYNVITVAGFLGWMTKQGAATNRVDFCLNALDYIEKGVFDRSHFEGLNTQLSKFLLQETRRVHKNIEGLEMLGLKGHELKVAQQKFRTDIPRKVSDALRAGEGTVTIHERTNALMGEMIPREHRLPMLDVVVDKLSAEIRGFLDAEGATNRSRKLQEILDVQSEMSPESRRKLVQLRAALDYLGHKCLELAKAIRPTRRLTLTK